MARTYPYPKAEHYVEPVGPVEVLREEMRFYPEAADFRKGITTIERYYTKTLLFDCFRKFALLDVHALAQLDGSTTSARACSVFYAGETLAAHALLRPLPREYRQEALRADFFPEYPRGLGGFDPEDEAIAYYVDELIEQRHTLWEDFCDRSSEEYKEKIIEVIAHAYRDVPSAGYAEDQFMGGYLFGERLIGRALADVVEYEF